MSRSRERKSEVWGSDFQSLKFLLGETIWNVWFHERTQDIIVGWHSGWQWEHSKTIGKGVKLCAKDQEAHSSGFLDHSWPWLPLLLMLNSFKNEGLYINRS